MVDFDDQDATMDGEGLAAVYCQGVHESEEPGYLRGRYHQWDGLPFACDLALFQVHGFDGVSQRILQTVLPVGGSCEDPESWPE